MLNYADFMLIHTLRMTVPVVKYPVITFNPVPSGGVAPPVRFLSNNCEEVTPKIVPDGGRNKSRPYNITIRNPQSEIRPAGGGFRPS